MKIAVMMVTYNRVKYLKRTVHALIPYVERNPDLHLHITDNHSDDESGDFLRYLQRRYSQITILLNQENLGCVGGLERVFYDSVCGQGYDMICKADDDELLPEDWMESLSLWPDLYDRSGVMYGFRRKDLDEYFHGLEWISRYPHNHPFYLKDFECYLSYIVPGFQISTEEWWKKILPYASDFGEKFGGYDASIAMGIAKMAKKCVVINNREAIHFQDNGDYPDYSQGKFEQWQRVRDRIFQLREEGAL